MLVLSGFAFRFGRTFFPVAAEIEFNHFFFGLFLYLARTADAVSDDLVGALFDNVFALFIALHATGGFGFVN